MSIPSAIAGSTCIFSAALLLSARYIAAAIYGIGQTNRDLEVGLRSIGQPMVVLAWLLLIGGVAVLVVGWVNTIISEAPQQKHRQ